MNKYKYGTVTVIKIMGEKQNKMLHLYEYDNVLYSKTSRTRCIHKLQNYENTMVTIFSSKLGVNMSTSWVFKTI